MKKTIATTAILALSTMAYGATDSWYIGAGYDGVSIKKDLTKQYTAQVTYGGFGDLSGFKGKVLYKFQRNRDYNLYAFGGVMYASEDETTTASGGYGTSAKSEIDITTKGAEFGVGLEYDLRTVWKNNIPLFVSIEVGYRASSTDVEGDVTTSGYTQNVSYSANYEVDHSGAIGGVWIHYRF